MASFMIQGYMVLIEPGGTLYRVGFLDPSGMYHFKVLSGPEELLAIVDILRNESPVYYDTTRNLLSTGSFEPVGESE